MAPTAHRGDMAPTEGSCGVAHRDGVAAKVVSHTIAGSHITVAWNPPQGRRLCQCGEPTDLALTGSWAWWRHGIQQGAAAWRRDGHSKVVHQINMEAAAEAHAVATWQLPRVECMAHTLHSFSVTGATSVCTG